MIFWSTGKYGTTHNSNMNTIAAVNDVLCAQMLNAPVFSVFKNASQYKLSQKIVLIYSIKKEKKKMKNHRNKKLRYLHKSSCYSYLQKRSK